MDTTPQEIINKAPRLTISDTISFACRKELPCFNQCCADINIVLTPLDIIRLKNRLGISSDEFLGKYGVIPFNKQQKLPVVILKMEKNERKSCQLLSQDGCTVYEDRPWACRMYPVGLAASEKKGDGTSEVFYFLMDEEQCQGLKENREITIEDWIKEQGIGEYEEVGQLFNDVTMHKAMLSGHELGPKQMEMFYMVCYNIDKFRRFVFESRFLQTVEVDEALLDKLKTDDIELFKFGINWLKFSLFNEKTMKIKPEVLESKKTMKTSGKAK
jgi:Fe-S-cluster containining protein